jgi:hypothetical protein
MHRKIAVIVAFVAVIAVIVGAQMIASQKTGSGPLVEVFKTPTCGCCSKWVEHLRTNGFTVRTTDLTDLHQIKSSRGIPAELQSCHTAIVGGYVVEGHVPASDVQRLLKEKPAVVGIAVGGMPVGSPGMEFRDLKPQAYNVMSFDKAGKTAVYAKH